MYEHILVATGGSPWSDAAVTYAIAIAARTGGTLRILTVLTNPAVYATPDVMGGSEVVAEIMERDGQALLARVAAQAHQGEVTCDTSNACPSRSMISATTSLPPMTSGVA